MLDKPHVAWQAFARTGPCQRTTCQDKSSKLHPPQEFPGAHSACWQAGYPSQRAEHIQETAGKPPSLISCGQCLLQLQDKESVVHLQDKVVVEQFRGKKLMVQSH